jgi:hypothetical protein
MKTALPKLTRKKMIHLLSKQVHTSFRSCRKMLERDLTEEKFKSLFIPALQYLFDYYNYFKKSEDHFTKESCNHLLLKEYAYLPIDFISYYIKIKLYPRLIDARDKDKNWYLDGLAEYERIKPLTENNKTNVLLFEEFQDGLAYAKYGSVRNNNILLGIYGERLYKYIHNNTDWNINSKKKV